MARSVSRSGISTATAIVSESEIHDTNGSANENAVAEMIACRIRRRYKLRILNIRIAICLSL
jgi:hypothetical protein